MRYRTREAGPFSGTESPSREQHSPGGSPHQGHHSPDESQIPPNSCGNTSSYPAGVTTQATRGRTPLPCALSSLTEPGVQCWVLGSGAGRWGAAGAEGTAGQLHTAMRAPGCGAEGSAPHSPANLGRNFVYLQGTGGKKKKDQSGQHLPRLQTKPHCSWPRGPSWLSEMSYSTGEWRACPEGPGTALRPGLGSPASCSQPHPLRAPYSKSSTAVP